ncbi:MAG: fold metallo-hydrolase [Rhodospirillales bacterium]|nr:fold metallo-hydrolase [Rhodospirillales bacterium]
MHQLGSTMRVLRPAPHVVGFYDGRIAGLRAHSEQPNWLDDGAFTLGICSYAIVDGADALVYDTHISRPHAGIIRRTLEELGVTRIRVALSHWHADHIAGNEVFADCEIIANHLTAKALRDNKERLEARDPPIKPLIPPNRLFEGALSLTVGTVEVELRQAEIHSHDGTVLFLPQTGVLIAGDTLEDPITYVVEPHRLQHHLAELRRLAGWAISRILPSHGALEVIEAGGYGKGFIEASLRYVEKLDRCRTEPGLAEPDLRRFAAEAFDTGAIGYFAAYEPVHRSNLAAVAAAG